jgi:acyl-coenzyme A thioesterase PaaI-like protein
MQLLTNGATFKWNSTLLKNKIKMYKRIKESFDKQGLMKTLNTQLEEVEKGKVKITCEFSEGLTQQHGFFHAGVTTSIADSTCGYAALTMMPENTEVLSVDFKIVHFVSLNITI